MKTSVGLLIITSVISFSAFATKNINTENDQLLLASCQALLVTPEQENAKDCIYFIEGFLVAAQTIDPPVINNQSEKKRKFYGFMSSPCRNWGLQYLFFT